MSIIERLLIIALMSLCLLSAGLGLIMLFLHEIGYGIQFLMIEILTGTIASGFGFLIKTKWWDKQSQKKDAKS